MPNPLHDQTWMHGLCRLDMRATPCGRTSTSVRGISTASCPSLLLPAFIVQCFLCNAVLHSPCVRHQRRTKIKAVKIE
ncbi:hypothetical protein PLICRDRAFT_486183 [Plicaturopsis crispa FD-325 SS-3]|nr:hypothetical protein PLICRDRAFT_486183 [Plicaturopsis crispa FD-325 SS-3]